MAPDGRFVVVWNSAGQDGSDRGIFAQVFDSAGTPRGGEFQVNTFTALTQYIHHAVMAPDGSFVIAWNSLHNPLAGYEIVARRFDSDGVPIDAEEFPVNTYTTGYQQYPKIAMNGSGEYLIAWETDGPDGAGAGIAARRFDMLAGAIDAEEFVVNSYTAGKQRVPGSAIQENGDFVVVWQGEGQDGSSYGILARRFDSAGSALDAQEFIVNTYTTGIQHSPRVTLDRSGDIIVTWEGGGVFGRRVGPDGTPLDAMDFQMNTHNAVFHTLAGGGGTRVLSAWHTSGLDGSAEGVFAQLASCDTDGDGICDISDITLIDPTDTDLLDCSDPSTSRPTFTWAPGDFDRFKVFMGTSPGFEKGTAVTSGDKAIRTTAWQPAKKQWRRACTKALEADPFNPFLYVMVQGNDQDVPKSDPFRLATSPTFLVDVEP